MPEFLAETYTARDAPGIVSLHARDIAIATEQVNQKAGPVNFLGAVFLPQEETCFYLYQAISADAVREAMTRAGLRPERITQAVSIGWPAAAPDTGARQFTREI